MLPNLTEFGIESSVFIRKLDNRNHWNDCNGEDTQKDSALVAQKIFDYQSNKYSLWYVTNDEEFYGVIASLTTNATPQDRNIDFIWIYQSELEEVGIKFDNIPESKCHHVKDLHYDAEINQATAQKLCHILINKQRKAHRCLKVKTKCVLKYQYNKGCKASDINSLICKCEK
ncbi:MAG: hypothetical protein IM554_02865 [Pseudanabaena sp. M079S1SP2A07QC]|jgi:hypothetical protein|nr:hypothetical protein [Pseudanabaena sp. M090S1SP2A07QC]MCA6559701.1 hypothetical protein [Pseudanabaena sp. M079S1SP2A07QC]MCA6604333.1 hypothetical protein [Pseudanabaena sp. M007S1SP1A06QC]